ncbi:MAG: hypothetical protein WBX08_08230, partial [Candidatus Sulfotelmatobacter sp.]
MSRVCCCSVTLFVLALAAFMGGCSSSSSPTISVSLSPSSQQGIDQSQTVGITLFVGSATDVAVTVACCALV